MRTWALIKITRWFHLSSFPMSSFPSLRWIERSGLREILVCLFLSSLPRNKIYLLKGPGKSPPLLVRERDANFLLTWQGGLRNTAKWALKLGLKLDQDQVNSPAQQAPVRIFIFKIHFLRAKWILLFIFLVPDRESRARICLIYDLLSGANLCFISIFFFRKSRRKN